MARNGATGGMECVGRRESEHSVGLGWGRRVRKGAKGSANTWRVGERGFVDRVAAGGSG